MMERTSGKRVLDHREAHQQHDQNQSAAECGLDDVVGQLTRDRQPGAEHPAHHERPCGHQHDGAVITIETEEED